MTLTHDWYIYHSQDGTFWFLQEGGPYTEEEASEIYEKDEANRQDISFRVAKVQFPKGAIPDKKIERTGLDLATKGKDLI
jgi:hypothetical protein